MRDVCRRLLRRVPHVCLFVRPENTPAIRVYEAIGMRRRSAYRSLVF
jgi:predicted GNAT family acetyltransferase